ncbi:hypothetical protein ACLOAV_001008 [Pseudogymnoascus australis]
MVLEVDLGSVADYVAHVELRPLIDAFHHRKRIVIIAGAGISASAGIATFQDLPVKGRDVFSINSYINNDSAELLNKTMHTMYNSIRSASPTQFHLVIEELAKEGRLHRLYTQNIDGLDTQLPSLETKIPLPKEKPWPKSIQVHGDLRTVKCQANPTHLDAYNPELFKDGDLPCCSICKINERTRHIPLMRPRVWLYDDHDYADTTAIAMVSTSDLRSKPDAVIVVGTALKVESRRKFAIDMCAAARKCGGLTAWINLEPPSQTLDCFDIVVKGDSDTIAMHVSSWWLKDCPNIISNANIKYLQDKYKLFIARSTTEARRLLDHDQKKDPIVLIKTQNTALDSREKTNSIGFKDTNHVTNKASLALSHETIPTQAPPSIVPPENLATSSMTPLLRQSNSPRVSASGRQPAQALASNQSHAPVYAPINLLETASEPNASLTPAATDALELASAPNASVTPASQALQLLASKSSSSLNSSMVVPSHSSLDIIPEITPGWELEMSKRLDSVNVKGIKVQHRRSSSVLTTIANLRYKANIASSLWRLKHGEYLDDEVINAYIELLQRSNLRHGQGIQPTFILRMVLETPWKPFKKLLDTGMYSIFIPINHAFHWTFAVIKSQEKDADVKWEYFDSLGGEPPQVFLDWIDTWFPEAERQKVLPFSNPRQKNGVDCGLFVLLGIRLMASGRPHLFNQQTIAIIPGFRKRVLAELLAQCLNPSIAQLEEFKQREALVDRRSLTALSLKKKPLEDKKNTSASLFGSPSAPILIESDTSDDLNESEHEADPRILLPSTSRGLNRKESLAQLADLFGEEGGIVKTLREAVVAQRALQKCQGNIAMKSIKLHHLWTMISAEKRALRQRHIHYEFSRQFWAEMKK